MYNEGFVYRLLPLKPDSTVSLPEATNIATGCTNNVVKNKFRHGQPKTAKTSIIPQPLRALPGNNAHVRKPY